MHTSALSAAISVADAEFDLEPESGSVPRVQRQAPRLSEILWGIEWSSILPRTLVDDITVSVVDFDEARAFMEAHYAEIFQTDPNAGWFAESLSDAKERYLRHAADCFAFYDGGRAVGLTIWNPVDWSTYYIRTAGVLNEHAGRRLVWRLISLFIDELGAFGIRRLEAQTAPANNSVYLNALRLGYVVSGTMLSERWGAVMQLTRYLDSDAERVFGNQFCVMSRPTASQPDTERARTRGGARMMRGPNAEGERR